MYSETSFFKTHKLNYKPIFNQAIQEYIYEWLKKAYILMMTDENVKITKNDELKTTAQIYYFSLKIRDDKGYPFRIDLESPYFDLTQAVYGDFSPKKAKRLDLKITNNNLNEMSFITIECKRLSLKSNPCLQKKYVDEGISRFIKSIYCKNNNCSFMIGFIGNGTTKKIVSEINTYVVNKYSKSDILNSTSETIKFISKHERDKGYPDFVINHLFCRIDKLVV